MMPGVVSLSGAAADVAKLSLAAERRSGSAWPGTLHESNHSDSGSGLDVEAAQKH